MSAPVTRLRSLPAGAASRRPRLVGIAGIGVTSVQGTLALDLQPRYEPPLADVVAIDRGAAARLDQWTRRYAQAALEIVGGDRPASQLLRWSSARVYEDLTRRALLVARAGGHQPGAARVQPVRPKVLSSRSCVVAHDAVEASLHVRYGDRSRAVAARFELRRGRWICTALEFAWQRSSQGELVVGPHRVPGWWAEISPGVWLSGWECRRRGAGVVRPRSLSGLDQSGDELAVLNCLGSASAVCRP